MSGYLSDQPADPGTSHLSSNNPFRNRAVSPSLPPASPTSPFLDQPVGASSARPVSRNPFLDPAVETAKPASNSELLISLDDMATSNTETTQVTDPALVDLFSTVKIDGNKASPPQNSKPPTARLGPPGKSGPNGPPRRPMDGRPIGPPLQGGRGRGGGGLPPHAKNIPPRQSSPSKHRPSRSQEEAMRSRRDGPPGSRANGEPAPAGASVEAAGRRPSHSSRPRRNSESSVAGDQDKVLSKSERVIRDIRRRESDMREKGVTRPKNRRNDIIDQMDATSIFGTVFHHDGPFDALNPHRNRKGSRRAPIQAFPKDSLNNVMGGSGPINARPDHKTFMGEGDAEAFKDFAGNREDKFGSSSRMPVFDPTERGYILHGDQSLGLGTSTFLEGTPAARTAIQRREAEKQVSQDNPLQRKKSLAQRFRSINRGPREPAPARAFSTDGASISERLPMDEYDSKVGDDVITVRRKGSAIGSAVTTGAGGVTSASTAVSPASPTSPPRGLALERRSTTDASGSTGSVPGVDATGGSYEEPQQRSSGSGLLARVKSLKGGARRPPPPPPPPLVKDS